LRAASTAANVEVAELASVVLGHGGIRKSSCSVSRWDGAAAGGAHVASGPAEFRSCEVGSATSSAPGYPSAPLPASAVTRRSLPPPSPYVGHNACDGADAARWSLHGEVSGVPQEAQVLAPHMWIAKEWRGMPPSELRFAKSFCA
ncbi:unnamed protein product, partial [Urochloa humidicola]